MGRFLPVVGMPVYTGEYCPAYLAEYAFSNVGWAFRPTGGIFFFPINKRKILFP
ncbi:MAG: hypothetical protein KDD99_27810 [Bacteroidetes bacterium]|nr:hypothetical protein [Bacteroidota bacterium]